MAAPVGPLKLSKINDLDRDVIEWIRTKRYVIKVFGELPARGPVLRRSNSLSLAKWLGLLAIGVQLVLPLSVGLQINARGAAAALAAFDTELCLADHSVAAAVADTGDRSGPGGKSRGDTRAGACPLCLVLQVLHAFTDSPVAALPPPSISGKTLAVAPLDATATTALTASYQSRAPPVMA